MLLVYYLSRGVVHKAISKLIEHKCGCHRGAIDGRITRIRQYEHEGGRPDIKKNGIYDGLVADMYVLRTLEAWPESRVLLTWGVAEREIVEEVRHGTSLLGHSADKLILSQSKRMPRDIDDLERGDLHGRISTAGQTAEASEQLGNE